MVSKVIVDPSNDPSFYTVFSSERVKIDFLTSFLNSVYFPDAGENDGKIREVVDLQK